MKEFKGYNRGIDLGGWFSQCDYSEERFDHFIEEKDIERIASWGMDHVRLPIDYNLVETEEGMYIEKGFERLDRALSWIRKYNMNVVLDLHKTYGFSFDVGEKQEGFFEKKDYQERFYRLWEKIAERYAQYSDVMAFELLNEVTDKEYCDEWNRISNECVKHVRKYAPDVKILIGGYYNNSLEAVKDIAMPADENIVYNFHCYNPLIFTHQGAYWIPGMDTAYRFDYESTYQKYRDETLKWLGEVHNDFDGMPMEEVISVSYFETLFKEAVEVAEERNVSLYCGEYGVINLASSEDTMKWYRTINAVFEKYHIGRAAWSYKEMDFGIIDEHMDPVREELLKLL